MPRDPQVLGRRSAEETLGSGLPYGCGESRVHPRLPVIRVHLAQIELFGRQPVDVKPLADVPNDGARLRGPVVPLSRLLDTDGGP